MLKVELGELDLPRHAKVNFPNENDIMNFEVYIDLKTEECLWKGAQYKFTVAVPPNYPHEPPKCHCETLVSPVPDLTRFTIPTSTCRVMCV